MTRSLRLALLGGIFLSSKLSGLNSAGQQQPTAPAQTPPQQTAPTQQAPSQQNVPIPQKVPDDANLPEEDESVAPEKFVFNPLESERNVRVGNYYWHKGKVQAALRRYEWATKYNPSSAEAFFKVAEAENKLKNADAARVALKKVVDLAPDSKLGHEAKKKLASKS